MSTFPLGAGSPDSEDDRPTRGLGVATWLLLPLVLVGAFGIGLPVWRTEVVGRLEQPEPEPAGPLVPYADELLPLLDRRDLDPLAARTIDDLHRRLATEQREAGGISEKDRDRVQRLLDRYR